MKKIEELYSHVSKAKEELERMNVGMAHDELVAALNIKIELKSNGKV